jgi:hypothetical protein
MLTLVIKLPKSFNVEYVQSNAWIDMSNIDDSLQMILDDILSEYVNSYEEIVDSAVEEDNEEIREITSKSGVALLKRLKSKVSEELEVSKGIEKEFEATVFRTWRKPLDLLDLLLYLSLEVASEVNSVNRSETSSKNNHVQAALATQQTKACLIFNEIIHLLKSGFPSGAHSHWRTLHETACISYFISKHGKDVAKRFLDYEIVESYFQAQAIHEHQQKMECKTLPESEIKTLKKKINKMRRLYGPDFVKKANYPYGWIPRTVLKTRSLRGIEKSVKLDMLRPYYDIASYNVYGGPKRFMFKPGIRKKGKKGVILVGPSNYGLADPGKSAAISLGQVTACLLLAGSTIKKLVIVEAMRNLVDEICDAFCEIQAEFSKDSKTVS